MSRTAFLGHAVAVAETSVGAEGGQRGAVAASRLGDERVGVGQRRRVGRVVVGQPGDVEVDLVEGEDLLVGELLEPFGLDPLGAVGGREALHEVIEVGAGERLPLEREVLVGSQVVDPDVLGLRGLRRRLAIEEHHIGLHALSVETGCRARCKFPEASESTCPVSVLTGDFSANLLVQPVRDVVGVINLEVDAVGMVECKAAGLSDQPLTEAKSSCIIPNG